MTEEQERNELLIPALIPSLLEQEADYFSKHREEIKRAATHASWWKAHARVIEESERLPVSELLRVLDDFGYAKTDTASHPGEFSRRGGFLKIWPIQEPHPFEIEYLGNVIAEIRPAPTEAPETIALPKPRRGELERLQPGDYLIHIDHGIGIFHGMEKDFYVVEYAPPKEGHLADRLLVPTAQAKKLSRYWGFGTPEIHRLRSETWARTKRKTQEDVLKLARELLELYAKREVSRRPPYAKDPELEQSLAATFPHVETSDQSRTLEEIEADLESSKPMDRILVGDVGFGKTEIALRAASRVAAAGYQVAVLAPTTILAHQHAETFGERLRPLAIEVVELSRLTPRGSRGSVLADIAGGKVDIVIGTHRILSRDVGFKRLGLLIIDEEQRFGVRAKEKLKNLRKEIDVLSLSATPIPRTMHLVLSRLREVSTLETPPAGRIPIKTFVTPSSTRLIQEALAAELERGGQAFVLSNRIETLALRVREIKELIPSARIGFIHGRLHESAIVRTMDEFRRAELDILVATTIIENGLDLSNVNTLVVMDATRLGLGEAHQLRGRIGRGDRQAYAYFLYRSRRLQGNAKKRLETLRDAAYLGAGYEIAMKDLEIRGAGNILGKEQSGAMNAVGLSLYFEMLREALETMEQ